MNYPNLEVKLSLNDKLLAHLRQKSDAAEEADGEGLRTLLAAPDFDGFAKQTRAWRASIPYQRHTDNLSRYEAWYASLLHMSFRSAGIETRPEESSSRGRADLVLDLEGEVFILEFEMIERKNQIEATLEIAFAQMRARGNANKHQGRPVHLIAVIGGRDVRNLLAVRAEPAGAT